MQKIAEREAKEKEEEERHKKEALLLKASISSSIKGKNVSRTLPVRPIHGSPSSRSNLLDKEKSKKALKRAQMLQRKKAFDKQFKKAQAKILEGAKASLDDNKLKPVTGIVPSSEIINKLQADNSNKNTHVFVPSQENQNSIESENQSTLKINTDSSQQQNDQDKTRILDISNTVTLKKLIQQQQPDSKLTLPKKSNTSNARRKQGHDSKPISRVVHGAATFGTNSKGVCPCNVKAMYLCKQCGSAWHGDCINNDKICILCS